MKKIFVLLLISLAILFAAGCRKNEISAQDKKDGIIVASVNGEKITSEEIQNLIKDRPFYFKMQYETPEKKLELVENYINLKILVQEANKLGLDKTDEFQLKKQVLLVEELENDFLSRGVDITDDALRDYYEKNIHRFKIEEETVMLQHIQTDSLEEAQSAYKKIQEGIDFEQAVTEFSVSPTAQEGGYLPNLTKQSLPPDLAEIIWGLNDGEVAEPYKMSQNTYHIFKKIQTIQSHTKEFSEVEHILRPELQQLMIQRDFEDWMEKTTGAADIKIFDEKIKEISFTDENSLTSEETVAVVNSDEVKLKEVAFLLKNREGGDEFNDEETKLELVRNYTRFKLLAQEARNMGLDKTESFNSKINMLLIEELEIHVLTDEIDITENEIKEFYSNQPEIFKVDEESIELIHIQVSSKEQADKIIKEINKGLDFSEASKKYSSGPTAEEGGKLPYLLKSHLTGEMSAGLWRLNDGEISEPFQETDNVYHIFKKIRIIPPHTKPLDEVTGLIESELKRQKMGEQFEDYIEALKKQSDIKIYEENIEKIEMLTEEEKQSLQGGA